MPNMLDAALEWHQAGCSVIPISVGGNKKPAVAWKSYMTERADEAQIRRWWTSNPDYGIGIVCGAVSGNLEMLELEGRAVGTMESEKLTPELEDRQITYGWQRIIQGYTEWTPSGGLHFLYRVQDLPVPGNTKIAIDANGLCLSETRGEGGYVVVAPTSGLVHASGNPWTVFNGAPGTIEPLNASGRAQIHAAFKAAFDQRPPAPEVALPDFPSAAPRIAGERERPGDAWMRQTDWSQILCPEGWTIESQRGHQVMWTRPGKDRRDGCSASTGIRDGEQDCLWVWSSSTGLPTETPLTKLFVLAHYDFGGNIPAAAKALAAQGFGDAFDESENDAFAKEYPERVNPASKSVFANDVDGDDWSVSAAPVEPSPFFLRVASSYEIKRVKWLWEERAPIGEITLIPGREGVGKSLLLARLAADITTGKLAGEFFGIPRNIIYVAREDSWHHTVAPRFVAAGADMDRIFNICSLSKSAVFPDDIVAVQALAQKVDAGAFMFDPVISMMGDEVDTHKAQRLRTALEPMRAMADDLEAGIFGLVHFNKTTGTDLSSKVAGSRAWMEVARAAIAIARLPEDEDEDDPDGPDTLLRTRMNLVVVSQEKSNLGRLDLPNLTYEIISTEVQTHDGTMTNVGRIEWRSDSTMSASEAIEGSHKKSSKQSNTGVAVFEFIRRVHEMRGGSVATQEVMKQFTEEPYLMTPSAIYQVLSKGIEEKNGKSILTRVRQGEYIPFQEAS